jgi:hypothetical protein
MRRATPFACNRSTISHKCRTERAKRSIFVTTNVEAAMDAMRKVVQGNSTTARQLATLGMAGGLGGTIDYLHGGSFTAGAIAGAALGHLARHGTIKIDQRVAHSVGRMLAWAIRRTTKKCSH